MFLIYDVIYLVAFIAYLPFMLLKRKWHKGFWIRLGFISKEIREALAKKENIWIHAVSVGEVLCVNRLIQNLRVTFPNHQIVLSTVTKTGYELATQKTFLADIVIFAPLDLSCIVRKFINCVKPKIYIMAETEIWPNLLTALFKKSIPVVQVNGRISDKSFQHYRRFQILFKGILHRINAFCMQTPLDQERIVRLGANLFNVTVAGNMKFDDVPKLEECQNIDLRVREDQILLVAGSTHPGEEEIILKIYSSLLETCSEVRLVIAPRHVQRADEISKLVNQYHFHPIKFSDFKDKRLEPDEVIVVDAIGHLRLLYSKASIVFVGKSLTVGGGQNIIEPAFFTKAILVGPRMENFRDVVELFLMKEAILQVKSAEELLLNITDLVNHPEKREHMGRLARQVVDENAGATIRATEVISRILTNV